MVDLELGTNTDYSNLMDFLYDNSNSLDNQSVGQAVAEAAWNGSFSATEEGYFQNLNNFFSVVFAIAGMKTSDFDSAVTTELLFDQFGLSS